MIIVKLKTNSLLILILGLISFNCFADSILNSDFTWKNQDNLDVKLTSFLGKKIALSMFYTECKKTCPMLTMAAFKEIDEFYKKKSESIEFVLVSYDPEVDTPEALLKFKNKLNLDSSKWHLLTGSKDSTRSLAKAIGIGEYWKMDDHILHGFKILILDNAGNVQSTIDWDHRNVSEILK